MSEAIASTRNFRIYSIAEAAPRETVRRQAMKDAAEYITANAAALSAESRATIHELPRRYRQGAIEIMERVDGMLHRLAAVVGEPN